MSIGPIVVAGGTAPRFCLLGCAARRDRLVGPSSAQARSRALNGLGDRRGAEEDPGGRDLAFLTPSPSRARRPHRDLVVALWCSSTGLVAL
jgi:hypothetical protein